MNTETASCRVLFVEDQLELQRAYGRYFADRYEMAFALTRAEAIDQFVSFEPDVLVLDLHLPDTDGLDVMRKIRASTLRHG